MMYVYILRSINYPDQTYVGYTNNITARLKRHNDGHSAHTSKFKPWKLETYIAFSNAQLAIDFEQYLKTSAGKKIMSQRLVIKNIP